MSATRFPSPFRVLERLRRAVPGRYRRILPVALLLPVVVAAVGPWLLRGQGPAENASAPVAGGVAEIPMPPTDAVDGVGVPVPEPSPSRSLPSYAAVPRLTLPRALAEAQPAPLRPRPRPRRRMERPPAGPPAADPVIALVLDDMGHNMETVRRAAALPAPMTLSFLPYVQDAPRRVAVAREAGKEIFLHMPMEPESAGFDPGPRAIRAGQPAATVRASLLWALAQVPGAVGVNNHMGSRATADMEAMRAVMEVLRERDLIYVDSWTSPRSVAEEAARQAGILFGGRDVFIDNEREPAAIRRQLAAAERLARRRGTAIVIGHPHTVTLEVLERWIPEARARGVRFAELGTVVRRRRCPEIRLAGRCGARDARPILRAACDGGTGC